MKSRTVPVRIWPWTPLQKPDWPSWRSNGQHFDGFMFTFKDLKHPKPFPSSHCFSSAQNSTQHGLCPTSVHRLVFLGHITPMTVTKQGVRPWHWTTGIVHWWNWWDCSSEMESNIATAYYKWDAILSQLCFCNRYLFKGKDIIAQPEQKHTISKLTKQEN